MPPNTLATEDDLNVGNVSAEDFEDAIAEAEAFSKTLFDRVEELMKS